MSECSYLLLFYRPLLSQVGVALILAKRGVGPTRAARLLDAFGSVADVFAATEEELATLDGFGDTTASRITATIHEPRAIYHVNRDCQHEVAEV